MVSRSPASNPPASNPPLLLLVHLVAAFLTFLFFAIVPIACVFGLIATSEDGDSGGPMFLPLLVMGDLLFAVLITSLVSGAAYATNGLRRERNLPIWLPPLVVFSVITMGCWFYLPSQIPAWVFLAIAAVVTVIFMIHLAAVSMVWFLPRFLYRTFRISY